MAAFSSELKAAWLIGELWYVCTFSWQHGGVTHKREDINVWHFHVRMRAWCLWFDQSTGLFTSDWWISSCEFSTIHIRFIHLLQHENMILHWYLCVWFWEDLSFFFLPRLEKKILNETLLILIPVPPDQTLRWLNHSESCRVDTWAAACQSLHRTPPVTLVSLCEEAWEARGSKYHNVL